MTKAGGLAFRPNPGLTPAWDCYCALCGEWGVAIGSTIWEGVADLESQGWVRRMSLGYVFVCPECHLSNPGDQRPSGEAVK